MRIALCRASQVALFFPPTKIPANLVRSEITTVEGEEDEALKLKLTHPSIFAAHLHIYRCTTVFTLVRQYFVVAKERPVARIKRS